MTDFRMEQYIHTEDRESSSDLEKLLEQRIASWLKGEDDGPPDRIFVVTGWPGIGKTWFLRYVAHPERDLDGKYRLVYIDLEQLQQEQNPQAAVQKVEAEIENGGLTNERICFCVDHIPHPSQSDETVYLIEQRVLLPYFDERRAFLLLVRQHQQWGFITLPHPTPHSLGLLDQERASSWLTCLCSGGQTDAEVWKAAQKIGGHPCLLSQICEHGLSGGCVLFLTYWLERQGMARQRDEIMKVARALYPLESLEDMQVVTQKLGNISQIGCTRARMLLQKAGWVTNQPLPDGRVAPWRWNPVVRGCLQILYRS